MFWIYGGAYTEGGGNSPHNDGENFAKKGVVLVNFNYRLGVLGFYAHPELTKESGRNASGNQALSDAIAALKWVKANIAAVRWRSEQRHHLRRVGRRGDRRHAHRLAR